MNQNIFAQRAQEIHVKAFKYGSTLRYNHLRSYTDVLFKCVKMLSVRLKGTTRSIVDQGCGSFN